ncbi:MAG: 30S ribosomal protein S20 [Alphaproteobacteria bacterium]
MANHKSAKKRIERNDRARRLNQSRRSRIRGFARRVEEAIASGDPEVARARLRELQPEIHRGVNRGVVHRNTAARKLSRLSARIKALS